MKLKNKKRNFKRNETQKKDITSMIHILNNSLEKKLEGKTIDKVVFPIKSFTQTVMKKYFLVFFKALKAFLNSKSENRNTKQILISNVQNSKRFRAFVFEILRLFRPILLDPAKFVLRILLLLTPNKTLKIKSELKRIVCFNVSPDTLHTAGPLSWIFVFGQRQMAHL